MVISGKDKGRQARVAAVFPKEGRIIVEGVATAKRHTKPRPKMNQNDRVPRMQQGGIIEKPMPVAIGRVMLVCPRCDRPTRVQHLALESGARVRACGRCGQPVEVKGA
jgi:large subunit ribosomal protein L24